MQPNPAMISAKLKSDAKDLTYSVRGVWSMDTILTKTHVQFDYCECAFIICGSIGYGPRAM